LLGVFSCSNRRQDAGATTSRILPYSVDESMCVLFFLLR
jgi:hypothetical protein